MPSRSPFGLPGGEARRLAGARDDPANNSDQAFGDWFEGRFRSSTKPAKDERAILIRRGRAAFPASRQRMTPADRVAAILEPERGSYGGTADRKPPGVAGGAAGRSGGYFSSWAVSGADRLGKGAGGLPGPGAARLPAALSQADGSSAELRAGPAGMAGFTRRVRAGTARNSLFWVSPVGMTTGAIAGRHRGGGTSRR